MAPQQPVQALQVRRGEALHLEVLQGRVWLTRDGHSTDHFLTAGQRLACAGPACLRVSAEDQSSARLRWGRHKGRR